MGLVGARYPQHSQCDLTSEQCQLVGENECFQNSNVTASQRREFTLSINVGFCRILETSFRTALYEEDLYSHMQNHSLTEWSRLEGPQGS